MGFGGFRGLVSWEEAERGAVVSGGGGTIERRQNRYPGIVVGSLN